MAVQWILLAAEDRDGLRVAAANETIKTALEEIGLRKAVVSNPAVLVTGRIGRTSSEFAPEECVLDAFCPKRLAQRHLAELRRELAVGGRPNISDGRHRVLFEKLEELGNRVIGVPDGKDAS